METLSSSFLPKNPQLLLQLHSSFRIHVKKSNYYSTPHPMITTKSSFDHPIKNPPHERPHKQSNLLKYIFNTLDDFICSHLDPPNIPPSFDPTHVLSGNLTPVDELPPTACTVVEGGSLPPCLDGAYIRNGPNPQFFPKSPYFMLDGDGMLHMIKISRGEATFCSRFVKTHKFLMEREIGHPIVPNVFASLHIVPTFMARLVLTIARVLIGRQLDPLNNGYGVANTSVALLCGRLFALCKSDLPYEIKVTQDGDIITIGRRDFQSDEPFVRMTAHPKVDKVHGEVVGYFYDFKCPFMTFFRIDSKGRKQKTLPILSMKGFTIVHDFALTKNYIIFLDAQIMVNPLWVLRGRSAVGIDRSKIPRLGIIPRYAEDESEMRWIDMPDFNMLHCVNAWEEDDGDTIVIVGSNIKPVERIFQIPDNPPELTVEMITINIKAKTTVRRQALSDKSLDFGTIHPSYAAKKNRYVYSGVIGSKAIVGVVKLDLLLTNDVDEHRDCTVASRLYGSGCVGDEPFFVPRESNNPTGEEDDGYLVTYVHDENAQESKFVVMDAKSPTLDIIAAVKLPRRVPIGFHGLFVSDSDLIKL